MKIYLALTSKDTIDIFNKKGKVNKYQPILNIIFEIVINIFFDITNIFLILINKQDSKLIVFIKY